MSFFAQKVSKDQNQDISDNSKDLLIQINNENSIENEFENQSNINNIELQNTVEFTSIKPTSQQKLEKIREVRKTYNKHTYVLNDEYSLGVLNREIEFIQTEYEKRLFEENDAGSNYEFEDENKIGPPILDLRRCEELLEESKKSFQYGGSDSIKNHSFIKKLVIDIKKFIEEKL